MAAPIGVNFSKKSFVVITGASKGIGQAIAVELSKRLATNSIFVLLARSLTGLEETKTRILDSNKAFTVLTYSADLSSPDLSAYTKLFDQVVKSANTSNIDYGYLFHNAGHVGVLKEISELADLKTWREYFDLNFFSAVLLNNAFLQKFKSITKQTIIVNITSLVGRKPFVSMSMYGSAKASRDIFFKVLATEQPDVTVLNYSPGPVLTDMFNSVCDTAENPDIRRSFQETRKSSILTPEQTVTKLLNIIEKGNYSSGDTIDYFDQI